MQNKLDVIIEIPKHSNIKYEYDRVTKQISVDRILYGANIYPQNYGFIPRTYARDYDPLDVLVLCSESIIPMSFVECKPIGVLIMKDNGLYDEKIIAVPLHDPFYSGFENITEIPAHIMEEIKHFFAVYKTLEGKSTAIDEVKDVNVAKEIIADCISAYKTNIEPKYLADRKSVV